MLFWSVMISSVLYSKSLLHFKHRSSKSCSHSSPEKSAPPGFPIAILVIVFGWTLFWIALIVIAVLMIVLGIQGLTKKASAISALGQVLAGVLILLLAFGNKFAWNFVNVLYIVAGVIMAIDGFLLLLKK